MGRRRKELESIRDLAVTYLYEKTAEGQRLTTADWEHALTMSGYGRRQLKRLLDDRLADEPAEPTGFQVDE